MNGSAVGIDDPCDVWSVSVRKMILVNPSVSASLNASFVLSPCAELLWSDFALFYRPVDLMCAQNGYGPKPPV